MIDYDLLKKIQLSELVDPKGWTTSKAEEKQKLAPNIHQMISQFNIVFFNYFFYSL